jgi:general secretion pathway protein I
MNSPTPGGRAARPEADASATPCAPSIPVSGFGACAPPTSRGRRGERGFTLLEVLLAFALLATAMGLLIGMLSGGLRQIGDSAQATEASLHAQSLLDAVGTLEPLAEGHREGDWDDHRFRWTLDIEPMDDPAPLNPGVAAPAALLGGPVLYRITAVVAWGDGGPRHRLRLVTLRARTPTAVEGAAP